MPRDVYVRDDYFDLTSGYSYRAGERLRGMEDADAARGVAAGAFLYADLDLSNVGDLSGVTALNSGPLAGRRNAIINGDFRVWQRGASAQPDRWRSIGASGTTPTFSRQSFAPGAPLGAGNGEPQHFMRWLAAGTASGQPIIGQPIENVRTFAGEPVTISFWAKANAARTVQVQLAQTFGSGGSATVIAHAGDANVTTAWQKFVFAGVVLPSVAGKTIGAGDALQLRFYGVNGVADQQLDLARAQVERGSVATPFEEHPIASEEALCRRYFERFDAPTGFDTIGVAILYSSTYARAVVNHARKRVSPTISLSGAFRILSTSGTLTGVTLNSSVSGLSVTRLDLNVTGGATGATGLFTANGDAAARIDIDAEL